MKLRIATRKSQLALWQTEHVAAQIRQHYPNIDVAFIFTDTKGDQITHKALADIGGKALFVKSLEQKLLDDEADIAVHSLKDIPADLDNRFQLSAYLPRASAFDALVCKNHMSLDDLPQGAIVGTSSPRRQAQLRYYRPDLQTKLIRGNVDTRLQKVQCGEYDAIILAEAGLQRLGLAAHISQTLPDNIFLPAAGQGIIAVEALRDNKAITAVTHTIDDPVSHACAVAEQTMVKRLQGDCHSPIGAYAVVKKQTLTLQGRVLDLQGKQCLETSRSGPINAAKDTATLVADVLIEQGAKALLS